MVNGRVQSFATLASSSKIFVGYLLILTVSLKFAARECNWGAHVLARNALSRKINESWDCSVSNWLNGIEIMTVRVNSIISLCSLKKKYNIM